MCPSVTANCIAGPNEILDGGRLGHLAPVEDHQALAEALDKHLRNPDRLNAMAAKATMAVGRRSDANSAALNHVEALKRLRERLLTETANIRFLVVTGRDGDRLLAAVRGIGSSACGVVSAVFRLPSSLPDGVRIRSLFGCWSMHSDAGTKRRRSAAV